MTYCTRCDMPLRDGEKCSCSLPEPISPSPAMDKKDKSFLTIAVSSFIAVMAAIVFFVPPMLGFNKECRQEIADKAAVEISEAAQAAIREITMEGYETMGEYIVSYDDSDYSYVPFDTRLFDEKFRHLADKDIADDYGYFVKVKNGEVEYTAVSESWYSKLSTIGTYPPSPAKELTYYGSGGDEYKVDNLTHLRDRFIGWD